MRRIGDWRLVSRLHDGGMAQVWLAQRGDEPAVVLKLVHERFAEDAKLREMLEEEARIAAKVTHPNVIRILEVDEVDEIPYLVMERCDGRTLAALLTASVTFPVPEAVAIARDTARGLHAAHEAIGADGRPLELVHRDVSPSNVMLGYDGVVKIIDFGIAWARGRAIKTSAGTVKGKFRYIAPEALTGQTVDRRFDLYALGIVLWELLTGRRYFDAKNEVDVLMMARSPRWIPARTLRADVPEALDAVLRRALAARAADRYPTGAELADALTAAVPEATAVTPAALGALAAQNR
ncbi:MAG: serine/threonine protein kinase [Sandaracinaceae bacterium]|nr:serine/threonine protein kinase [Sandaracinaceae bacterium]